MKTFRTELITQPSPQQVDLNTPILTIGSCFSDSIGNALSDFKFKVLTNPFGTNFNPLSIHKNLMYAIDNSLPDSDGFVHQQELWNHYDFHSAFAAISKEDTAQSTQRAIQQTHHFLSSARYIIITYGTAWAYQRHDNQQVVANCHKVPSKQFTKRLLSVEEITDSFNDMFAQLKASYPNISVILTLSPVRHIKDTLEGNNISKAILRVAINTIIQKHSSVQYFSAYEIMMDDLRDYRFYQPDMIHPTQEAIDYIWEKFTDAYCSNATKDFLIKWKSIRTALHHKPFHSQSASHQKFLQDTLHRLNELSEVIDVSAEANLLTSQLLNR